MDGDASGMSLAADSGGGNGHAAGTTVTASAGNIALKPNGDGRVIVSSVSSPVVKELNVFPGSLRWRCVCRW